MDNAFEGPCVDTLSLVVEGATPRKRLEFRQKFNLKRHKVLLLDSLNYTNKNSYSFEISFDRFRHFYSGALFP